MIYVRILSDFLFFFYALFLVSSTFSIAVAQIALGVSLLLYLVIVFLKKENPFGGSLKYFYLAITAYLFWMVVSSLFSQSPAASLLILKEEWLFTAVPIGIFLLQKESYRHKIIVSFAAAIGLIAFYAVLQHFFGFHWFKSELHKAFDYGYTVKGFFPHRLTFGNYYAVVSMFLLGFCIVQWKYFSLKIKMVCLIVILMSLAATLFSYSYGPILALIISAFIAGLLKYRKYALILLVLIVGSGVIFYQASDVLKNQIDKRVAKELSDKSQSSRLYIWSNSFEMIKAHPVTGVGQGNFYAEFEQLAPGKRVHVHAHNDIINIAAIGGIPASIAFMSIWLVVLLLLYRGFKAEKNEGLQAYFLASFLGSIAFLVSSLTEATFADEEVRQMLMGIWALGLFPYVLKGKKPRND